MPQWRKLHSKITESLDVNDMPDDFTRLLWVLLPTQLCREGRGVDNPSWVRSRVFPMREDVTLKMVTGAMDWFAQRGMIVRYQVGHRSYFYVPTFHHYQGSTEREAQSEYPVPPDECATYSRPTHDLLTTYSGSDSDVDADSDSDSEEEVGARCAQPAEPEPVLVAVQEPEPEPKRVSHADPRTKHPAIALVKGITGRNPNRALYDSIIQAVGETPRGEDAAACYREWVKRGYNPNALTWLTDWYPNGIPKSGPRPGNGLAAVDAMLDGIIGGNNGHT